MLIINFFLSIFAIAAAIFIKKAGVKEEITFAGEEPEKKFSKHKIKTENGIELSVPTDIYKDKNAIEFINNPDGTISILITNVKIKK